MVPCFTGSLYYLQLWDYILENEELMKCLGGNIVSWEDVWLVNKIIQLLTQDCPAVSNL